MAKWEQRDVLLHLENKEGNHILLGQDIHLQDTYPIWPIYLSLDQFCMLEMPLKVLWFVANET